MYTYANILGLKRSDYDAGAAPEGEEPVAVAGTAMPTFSNVVAMR